MEESGSLQEKITPGMSLAALGQQLTSGAELRKFYLRHSVTLSPEDRRVMRRRWCVRAAFSVCSLPDGDVIQLLTKMRVSGHFLRKNFQEVLRNNIEHLHKTSEFLIQRKLESISSTH